MLRQCLCDGSVVRALSAASVAVASHVAMTFLLDYCHAMFIACWLCAASRVFVCFVVCVCTVCAPMCAVLFGAGVFMSLAAIHFEVVSGL